MKFHKAQQGFAHVMVVLAVLPLAGISYVGYYVWQHGDHKPTHTTVKNASQAKDSASSVTNYEECLKASGSVQLTVYPSVCTTKDGKTFKQPTSTETQSRPYTTVYSKVPTGLQVAILSEEKKDAPACVKNDQLVDYKGNSDDPLVDYDPLGFAGTVIGCGDGAWGIFAKVDGNWQFLSETQFAFACSLLEKYHYPSDLLALNSEPQCFDSSNNLLTYKS